MYWDFLEIWETKVQLYQLILSQNAVGILTALLLSKELENDSFS